MMQKNTFPAMIVPINAPTSMNAALPLSHWLRKNEMSTREIPAMSKYIVMLEDGTCSGGAMG